MQVHLGETKRSVFELWGGGPQGGLLTGLLFCLLVSEAGNPCDNTQDIVSSILCIGIGIIFITLFVKFVNK